MYDYLSVCGRVHVFFSSKWQCAPVLRVYCWVCVQVCQAGQEEIIIRDSSAGSLSFPQRILFAICHKKSSVSPTWLVSFSGVGILQKCQQMETAPWNIFQAHLILGRAFCSAAVWQSPCPSFPRRNLVSRKCWLIFGSRQNLNYLICCVRNEQDLNNSACLHFAL